MTFQSGSAWVNIGGFWPFCVGPHRNGRGHGVVRIGGRVEAGESAPDAARREWLEEAGTEIDLVEPPACFTSGDDLVLREVPRLDTDPSPVFYRQSAVFLGRASSRPIPGHECRGILMLSPDDIGWLCAGDRTLEDALAHGIEMIESAEHPSLDRGARLLTEWPHLFRQVLERFPGLGDADIQTAGEGLHCAPGY